MRTLYLFILLVFSFLFMMAPQTNAASRTALVIGNSAYKASPLKNPVNDAKDMEQILKDYGFDVTLLLDASYREMKTAVRTFGKKLRNRLGTGLFYYAGHGVQFEGRNYLLPINAEVGTESEIEFESIDASRVLGQMEDANNDLNIVILDACRNNPFSGSFRSVSRGLAKMDAPTGSIVAYATAPGELAADGEGRNGLYTKYLIHFIQKPGLKIEEIFKSVRVAVVAETANKQVPWESSSLIGTFYFDPQKSKLAKAEPKSGTNRVADNSEELLFWQSIKDSKNPRKFKAYLEQYPNGIFAKIAEINVDEYTEKPEKESVLASVSTPEVNIEPKQTEARKKEPEVKKPTIEKGAVTVKKETTEKPVSEKTASIKTVDEPAGIIARDGQYVKYKSGVVLDTESGLEWYAGPDEHTEAFAARSWVKNLKISGGGWRMPKMAELENLYSFGLGHMNMTPLLNISGHYVWATMTDGFNFKVGMAGTQYRWVQSCRVIAIRKAEKSAIQGEALTIQKTFSEKPAPQKTAAAETVDPVDKKAGINSENELYVKYPNGVVYDKKRDLEWYTDPKRSFLASSARSWVQKLSIGGGGWGLVSEKMVKELCQDDPALATLIKTLFGDKDVSMVWVDPENKEAFINTFIVRVKDCYISFPHTGEYFNHAIAVRNKK